MNDATSFNVPPNHAHENGVLQCAAFRQALHVMENRINAFVALPIASLQQSSLTAHARSCSTLCIAPISQHHH
ncbi:hypothetical protein EYR27_09290 [Xanthomonas oryzae]|nr:hypothetical protein EYR27_09290 [Xanthomonas oryzae]